MRLPGYAYNSIVNLTCGATQTSACAQQRGSPVWVCKYARPSPAKYQAEIVWNALGNATYTMPGKFTQSCDLKGNVTPIKGKKVQIGIWPILLENEKLGTTACLQPAQNACTPQ
jgi:hypothetical protein